MQLEDYFEFLAPDEIRIKGHRIGIEDVLYEYIYRERTPEQIARRFPSLTLDKVYAAILYYLRHKEAMSQYVADWLEFGERARREQQEKHPEFEEKVRQLRAEQRTQKPVPE